MMLRVFRFDARNCSKALNSALSGDLPHEDRDALKAVIDAYADGKKLHRDEVNAARRVVARCFLPKSTEAAE